MTRLPDLPMLSLASKRVAVTGGHGFLGRHVVAALEQRGSTVLVPRKAHTTTREPDVDRMYASHVPSRHGTGRIGGIGSNRAMAGRSLRT